MSRNWLHLISGLGIYLCMAHASVAQDRVRLEISGNPSIRPASSQGAENSFDAFFAALRHKESRGDYKAVNTLNFIGAYQFGEAALVDLGYVRRDRNLYDNNYSGGFTGKHGIHSVKDFLNAPRVQDQAARDWVEIMWRYIEGERLSRYAWTDVGGVTLSPSGMLAATHLLGTGGLKEFIRSGGSSRIRDPYGMPLVTYIKDLGGFDIPFAPGKPDVVAALQ